MVPYHLVAYNISFVPPYALAQRDADCERDYPVSNNDDDRGRDEPHRLVLRSGAILDGMLGSMSPRGLCTSVLGFVNDVATQWTRKRGRGREWAPGQVYE